MKCTCLVILICFITLQGLCQNVTISERDIPLGKMLNIIRKQTGYYFSFSTGITGEVTNVSLNVKNKPLKAALDILFSKLPYTYLLKDKIILIIDRKNSKPNIPLLFALSGIVETENGEPIEGATISIMNTKKGFTTNSSGQFTISELSLNTILNISSIGYETKQIVLVDQAALNIKLKPAIAGLDEALVVGYGKTSRRLNTGNVAKVKGSEIVDQPVTNFIAALTSRVPSMLISQVNGIPGSAYKTQIQGRSSIGTTSRTDPETNVLYIVDGTPFALNNNNLPTIASGSSFDEGRNSFDLINTNDIESIEVLKDADATAIYGSRGANGVVLITTKKGINGKTAYHFTFNTGIGRITRYPDMMNTTDYIKMRRSAILNDGNSPSLSNAPDIFKWDSTSYTDFRKIMIGGTSRTTNAYFSVDGGKNLFSYYLSGGLRKQTMVFPGDFGENTFYTNGDLHYRSINKRLIASFNILATHDDNLSPSRDMTTYISLPPTAPALYDSIGGLIWQHNGYSFNNPMATLKQPYKAATGNILLNFNSTYKLSQNVAFKINTGLNNISANESILQPKQSQNTFANPNAVPTSYFANTKLKSWILEPQIEYNSNLGNGKFSVLVGSTYQTLISRIANQTAYFSNDSVITDIRKSSSEKTDYNNSTYKYVGVFTRISYDYLDKYIINVTGRRDGSSRFGAGKQFGNFGAIGAAWIFTKEPFIYNSLPFLDFGKIRTSYGITGSDQIGDYKYLDQWIPVSNSYQGVAGITPLTPENPYYGWQTNKKLAVGFEIGIFKNKLALTTDYYRNRTGDQIITVPLPGTTGFDRLVGANFPAVVQNSGWEFTLQLSCIKRKDYDFNSKIVLTVPKNKLTSFPNIGNSLYANRGLYMGKSISSISGLKYSGIDNNTGLFAFKDFDNSGTVNYPGDYSIIANLDPKYYGSVLNQFRFKNFELECLIEMKNQISDNFLHSIYQNKPPGGRNNQPALLNSYWQKAGDNAFIQKLTANTSSDAYNAIQNFISSDAVYSNAGYWKIKYAALSYSLSESQLHKLHLTKCRFYVSSNNLAIITRFKATDPETIKTSTLPPLRTIFAGIQMGF